LGTFHLPNIGDDIDADVGQTIKLFTLQLYCQVCGGGLRIARVHQEDAANKSARYRSSQKTFCETCARKKFAMNKSAKRVVSTENIFRDLGFDDAEAENLKLRSTLMQRVEKFVKQSNMTQSEAASVLGVTQPRLNQLLKGKIQLFSLDALVNMLANAGMRVTLTIKKAA
jgi:predicted XRE-type DNA-binding protein/rRNA maturation protein Nop10